MTPAARLSAAIEILDIYLAEPGARLEPILARWGRENRYAGSKDRAAIADRVYDGVRRRRSYGARMGESGRGLVLASLAAEGADVDASFSGAGYAPPPPTAEERAQLARTPSETPPDWPDWLWPELARSVSDPAAEAAAIARRAAADLRVNTLKATVDAARAALAEDGVDAAPAPISPIGLRLAAPRKLGGLRAYRNGLVEPQDAASQAVALLAGVQPGETALDYCAGGGGKTLALAAAMANRGRLIAHDVDAARMADIPGRARRAGARVEITRAARDLPTDCDLVFVDAPCSGSGAWARQPDEKWRLTSERLAALGRAQADALRNAARHVRPGGRLLYATCSLLACENDAVAEVFLADHPEFAPAPMAPAWRAAGLPEPAPVGCAVAFTPAIHGTDGFFATLLRRRA